jgi:outer membrane immunogenic protein
MRKILPIALVVASIGASVQSGFAADIPARAARVAPLMAPAVAGFSWTGCYVGANVGYGWAPTDWDVAGSSVHVSKHDADGVVAGGQLGCDLQTSGLVFGLEGMWDWSGMEGSSTRGGGILKLETDANWIATVTGRVGLAVDRALFYVKGGGAWVSNDYGFRLLGFNFRDNDSTHSGWTAGVGVEWSFAPAWSAKLEYNFIDVGHDTPRFCGSGAGCGTAFKIDQDIHLVMVGVNYRFWGR